MDQRLKDITIAVVAIAAAVVSLYLAFGRGSKKLNLDTYDVLGVVTAEETAKLIGNKGQVLVMAPDAGAAKIVSVEAEMKSFRQTLAKQKGINVVSEKVSITAQLMLATGGGVPPDRFLKALTAHPNTAAIVLFFAFPQLSESELDAFKKSGVKTVVVSSFRTGYKQLLEQQVIQMAIIPRMDTAPTPAQPPRNARDRFDQDFTIITPADSSRLP